jgi:hypothetical protein
MTQAAKLDQANALGLRSTRSACIDSLSSLRARRLHPRLPASTRQEFALGINMKL